MTELARVLTELRTGGGGSSRDVAEATGIPVKRVSMYLRRAERRKLAVQSGRQENGIGRPSNIYWPA